MPTKRKSQSRVRTVADVATKALRVALMTKSLLNVEYKHVDTPQVASTTGLTPVILPLNAIAEGNASNQRDGLSVLNKSVQIKYYCEEHASAYGTIQRVMLIRDKQPNGTTPLWSDIFEEQNVMTLLNNVNTSRFDVMYSRTHTMSSTGSALEHGNIYRKLNFHTRYLSGGGAATDIGYGGLYIVSVSNLNTFSPNLVYSARVRYLDN